MRVQNELDNLFFLSLVYICVAGILSSCSPDEDSKNPTQYEQYISISADQTPDVSPDGKWIAYFHKSLESPESRDYPTGLYIMDSLGLNRRLLLKGTHFQPSWSPDSKWLVFTSEGVLQIISIDSDSIRTFGGIGDLPLLFPDWSGDGKVILFSSPYVEGGGVFSCSPDFNHFRQIYNHYELSAYPVKLYSQGQFICCLYSQEWSSEEIFIIDTALIQSTRLTFNNYSDRYPAVSPFHDYIAWSSNVQIWRMNNDGTNQKRLDYGQYPSWTPDGRYLVYSFANSDFTKEVIWKIDINGNNKTQLTY